MTVLSTDSSQTETGKLLLQLQLNRDQREERPAARRAWQFAGAILLVLVSAAGAAMLFVSRGEQFEIETAVAVAPSVHGGSNAILQASGYVTARRQATVSAQITGTLTDALIEEGEYVKVGQVLTRLENAAQRAALAQAQAQFQATQAVLVQFDVQLAQARRDLNRYEDLLSRQLVSQQALETAHMQVETLQAQVASQRKQVELSQAAVRGAEVQLNYTTVRAPFSGVIVAKAAQPGEIISPISAGGGFTRTGVGTIVDMDSLEIEVDVNESYINRVAANQPAEAALDAYPGWTIPAHVIAIIPTADRSKATVKVRVAIEQKDSRILPDMGVRVSFLEDASKTSAESQSPKGVLIPISAIVERAGRSTVFTVYRDRVQAQAVTLGQTYGDLRLVEGIASATTVVRAPPIGMNDGARIVVKQQKSITPASMSSEA